MFDIGTHLDELRSWPTTRLLAHHEELLRAVRRLQLEDLDVLPRHAARSLWTRWDHGRGMLQVRAVMLRDGHCQCGNCDLRYGLQAHHLRPRSWVATTRRRTWPWSRACTIRC